MGGGGGAVFDMERAGPAAAAVVDREPAGSRLQEAAGK